MEGNQWNFCRYGDDVNIYCNSYEEALYILSKCREHIEGTLLLSINEQKTGIYQGINRRYLGYEFCREKNGIRVRRQEKIRKGIHYNWQSSAIQKVDQNYHIISDGILTRKDYTLLFEKRGKQELYSG